MYGYQPPNNQPEGSWGETILMIKVVFQMLAPILGMLIGSLTLVVLTIVLFFQSPWLALIPLGAIVSGLRWLVRRDQRLHAEAEKRIFGP